MQQITSIQNPRIQALRALRDRRAREASGSFLVEGGKMVEEALRHAELRCALVEEERLADFAALAQRLEAAQVPMLAAPRRVLEAVCDTRTPQGIAAEVALPAPGAPLGERIVALDGVQDPGNVGTILRTADAAGFTGMLASAACADVYGSKTLRATMGSIFRLPVRREADLAAALAALRAQGYAILSSQLEGEDFFARGALPERRVLVIGSEAEGVCEAVSAVATHRLRLPMRGGAESLNAAVAAGIMLYDLMRG